MATALSKMGYIKSHFLKLTNDAAFKAYFKSNEEALKSLLTHFLPLPRNSVIIGIKILDPDLPSRGCCHFILEPVSKMLNYHK